MAIVTTMAHQLHYVTWDREFMASVAAPINTTPFIEAMQQLQNGTALAPYKTVRITPAFESFCAAWLQRQIASKQVQPIDVAPLDKFTKHWSPAQIEDAANCYGEWLEHHRCESAGIDRDHVYQVGINPHTFKKTITDDNYTFREVPEMLVPAPFSSLVDSDIMDDATYAWFGKMVPENQQSFLVYFDEVRISKSNLKFIVRAEAPLLSKPDLRYIIPVPARWFSGGNDMYMSDATPTEFMGGINTLLEKCSRSVPEAKAYLKAHLELKAPAKAARVGASPVLHGVLVTASAKAGAPKTGIDETVGEVGFGVLRAVERGSRV